MYYEQLTANLWEIEKAIDQRPLTYGTVHYCTTSFKKA